MSNANLVDMVDLTVSLRLPGAPDDESVTALAKAAAAGGVGVAVVGVEGLSLVDGPAVSAAVMAMRAARAVGVRLIPAICPVRTGGTLADLRAAERAWRDGHESEADVVTAVWRLIEPTDDALLLRRIGDLARARGAIVVVPSVDRSLSAGAVAVEGAVATRLGLAAMPEAAEHAVAMFDRLDALYHVAGGSGRSQGDGPLHEMTDDGFDYTLDLNLKSVVLSNRAAVRQFLKQGTGGVILNMASVLGYSPSPKFFASHAYAAAKAGIIGFSKSIAAYYAPQNIRVNVIAPALVETPMSKRAATNDDSMQFIKPKQPLDGGRIGHPEDCDAAALLLLSTDSKFITGQVLAVDGGWTVSEGQIHAS